MDFPVKLKKKNCLPQLFLHVQEHQLTPNVLMNDITLVSVTGAKQKRTHTNNPTELCNLTYLANKAVWTVGKTSITTFHLPIVFATFSLIKNKKTTNNKKQICTFLWKLIRNTYWQKSCTHCPCFEASFMRLTQLRRPSTTTAGEIETAPTPRIRKHLV